MTGSFDKTVKIWSVDGKFIVKLDNFLSTVSGICYVPRNKTVWVAGGTSYASLFDPKSGDNVSLLDIIIHLLLQKSNCKSAIKKAQKLSNCLLDIL